MKTKIIFLYFYLCAHWVFAQKKPISLSDFDHWNSITDVKVSNNGQWVIYNLSPQDADAKMVFYPLLGNAIDTVPRAKNLVLNKSNEWAAFLINPTKSQIRNAKLKKSKKEDLPKDSLGIYQINVHELLKIPAVKSFQLPENSENVLAYLLHPLKNPKDSTQKKMESEEMGSSLVLYNFVDKTQKFFPFVYKYLLDISGKNLVFATTGSDSTLKQGWYHYDLEKSKLNEIIIQKGKVLHLTVNETGNHFVASFDPDTSQKSEAKKLEIWHYNLETQKVVLIADQKQNPGKTGWHISAEFEPRFSKDGSKLYFGLNRPVLPKDTSKLDEEIVKVDIWNWKDKKLMPQQIASLKDDLKKSFLAVWNTKNQKSYLLSNEEIPNILLTKNANEEVVLGTSNDKYAYQHWLFNPAIDVFLISTKDGQATRILENTRVSNLGLSPNGKYAIWYAIEDTAWYAHSVKSSKTYKLTQSAIFSNEADDDQPDYPQAYGLAGWTEEDDKVVIYDKYDLWLANPAKTNDLKKLTNGRQKSRVFRYLKTDEKETNLDLRKKWLLHVFEESTKKSGYASYSDFGEIKVDSLLLDNYHFSTQVYKAKEAGDVVYSKENFGEFPDLLVSSDLSFKESRKISEANSILKTLAWGNAELVKWTNLDGIELEGILYTPERISPTKKYPMITYFYEKLSDDLNKFYLPQPVRASINISHYVSNGYVVFVPNIIYKKGYPGQSAYNCVIPGVMKMLERSYIDRARLGIQGHSWGGYQTAYILTKTNLFAAAEAGAPVANMTSAYGGIRWETGNSRQGQYEFSQSRIGATLWEKPNLYLENSPLFELPKVNTPLLMMHNDDDGAVPWEQGIELFMGLKRLNKPVWLLNYNGEKHGLTQRKNRVDWTQRMLQFFDHFLKDASAPSWLSKGVPATQKTLNYGFTSD